MFAVILALLSLFLEWYSCTSIVYTQSGSYERDYQFSVFGLLSSGGVQYFEHTSFDHVANILGLVVGMVVLWALVSVAYISTIFEEDSGFVLGWITMALAVLPLAVYAIFIDSAAEADLTNPVTSGLSGGPLVALLAVMLQVGAIAARNAQVLRPKISAGRRELTQEELGAGDLPVR